MTKRDKEALEELLQSNGWAVYTRLIRENFNPENTLNRLYGEMVSSDSMETFGAHAAVLITAADTAERLIQLPYSIVQSPDESEEK